MLLPLLLLLYTAFCNAHTNDSSLATSAWYKQEIDFLARLDPRPTGSDAQNILIDHIERDLRIIGWPVYTDHINFTYQDPPLPHIGINIAGQDLEVSSFIPYSGTTPPSGISGKLVNLIQNNLTYTPDWTLAANSIAIANLTNLPTDFNTMLARWPGSPPFPPPTGGNPGLNAPRFIPNLTAPAAAGVKGIIYIWSNISTAHAAGLYVPFSLLPQGVPALFVSSPQSISHILHAAASASHATLTLPGRLIPHHPTRTLYTIIPGTHLRNESVIINTHTDGTNALEENGHIALLAYARYLRLHPPRRTTILLFVSGHMHSSAFATAPGKASTLWLERHRELWAGGKGLKAVFGSCVEHLGAVHFSEDVGKDTYVRTGELEAELLYAANGGLAQLVVDVWRGAGNETRVLDPTEGVGYQSGEGLPLFLVGIPEVSLVTAPDYLLKVFARGFDERELIDVGALRRQVESFFRLWGKVDGMSRVEIGEIPRNGTWKPQ